MIFDRLDKNYDILGHKNLSFSIIFGLLKILMSDLSQFL